MRSMPRPPTPISEAATIRFAREHGGCICRRVHGQTVCGMYERLPRLPIVLPGLPPAERSWRVLRREFVWRRSEFRGCYTRALQRRHDVAGRVALTFRIARNGNVYGIQVDDDDAGDPLLAACVARSLNRIPYAPLDDDSPIAVVHLAFRFERASTLRTESGQ